MLGIFQWRIPPPPIPQKMKFDSSEKDISKPIILVGERESSGCELPCWGYYYKKKQQALLSYFLTKKNLKPTKRNLSKQRTQDGYIKMLHHGSTNI